MSDFARKNMAEWMAKIECDFCVAATYRHEDKTFNVNGTCRFADIGTHAQIHGMYAQLSEMAAQEFKKIVNDPTQGYTTVKVMRRFQFVPPKEETRAFVLGGILLMLGKRMLAITVEIPAKQFGLSARFGSYTRQNGTPYGYLEVLCSPLQVSFSLDKP